jgi:hypothetical protein
MKRQIFEYTGAGRMPEFVRASKAADGNLIVEVREAPYIVDDKFREAGMFALAVLPKDQIEGLIAALQGMLAEMHEGG